MSQEEPLSRKEKKAQRDADRRKSGKKRKHEDVEDEQTTQIADEAVDQLQKDFIPLAAGSEAVDENKTNKSKSKKRKRDAEEAVGDATEDAADGTTPKPKKKKKKTKTAADSTDGDALADGDTGKTKSRFVVFIGNLPYKTTDTSLQTHFQKLQPFTLRHRLDPKTQKSKGFAFLEFENYDRMKTCLKLYHHSIFDPDDVKAEIEHGTEGSGANAEAPRGSKKKAARRINVELTAGGGGKNAGRKEKIKVKNERLNGQRQRRVEFERAEKEKEEQEGAEKGKATEKGKARDSEKRSKRKDKAKDPEKKKRKESVKDVLMAQVEERDAGGAEKKKQKESVKDVPVAPVIDHNAGMHPSRLARLGV